MSHISPACPSAVLAALAILLSVQPALGRTGTAARPNILFIAVDDLRPQTSEYGQAGMRTPALDGIARAGVRFERAFCSVPVCGASRASLLTGIRPLPDRFVLADTWAEKDAPGAASLPQVFKEAGYHTLSYGKIFHNAADMADASWSEPPWIPARDGLAFQDPQSANFRNDNGRGPLWEAPDVPDNAYPDGMLAERVTQDLARVSGLGKPFFMAVGFYKPHLPFYAPKKYWDLYDPASIQLADNRYRPRHAPAELGGSREYNQYHLRGLTENSEAFHRTMRRGYYASVSYVDAQIGKVLARLEEAGLAGNTLVVIWGDHGWNLGEHDFWGKHNLMHLATRVPLLFRGPGIPAGRSLPQLVESVDIFPTLLEYAGIAPGARLKGQLEGSSFGPLFQTPALPWKQAVFVRFKEGSGLVTPRYAYTTYGGSSEMLFDHLKDPDENENVAGQAAYRASLDSLRRTHAEGWKKAHPVKIASDGRKGGVGGAREEGVTGALRMEWLSRGSGPVVTVAAAARLTLRNTQGETVLRLRLRPGENTLPGSALRPGLHFYSLESLGSDGPRRSTGRWLRLP